MIQVHQTRYDYPGAAKRSQKYGWVLVRTYPDSAQVVGIPVMTEPYATVDIALQMLAGVENSATVAYAEIVRDES